MTSQCSQVVLFGTDIPDVSPEIVSAALAALDRHHLVLGPAADGGFYCIGISAAMPPGFLEVWECCLGPVPNPSLLPLWCEPCPTCCKQGMCKI